MNNAPHFSEQALEAIARLALLKFDPQYMNRKPGAIPIEYIIEEVYGLILDFRKLTVDNTDKKEEMIDHGGGEKILAALPFYKIEEDDNGTKCI